MKQKTIEKLCCPFDKSDLQLQVFLKDIEHNVLEGMLTCVSCQRKYPIVYGVPIMAPDEYRQPVLEQPIIKRWQVDYKLDAAIALNWSADSLQQTAMRDDASNIG